MSHGHVSGILFFEATTLAFYPPEVVFTRLYEGAIEDSKTVAEGNRRLQQVLLRSQAELRKPAGDRTIERGKRERQVGSLPIL